MERRLEIGQSWAVATQETHYVFQFINHSRKETLFSVTDQPIEKAVEALVKSPKSPTKAWEKGDTVEWRGLTPPMHPDSAEMFKREFESSNPKDREYALIMSA